MLNTLDYGIHEMPKLSEVLAEIARTPGTVRVHIFSGAPRYYFGSRQIRKVHAAARYRDGTETFHSKSLTDAVRGMCVARTVAHESRNSIKVFVFAPYGHKKDRPWKDEDDEDARDTAGGSRSFITIPDGIDEELPF